MWQNHPRYRPYILGALLLVVAFHVLFPLRHHLIPGDVAWTEEGHRYSWRMMLRSKQGFGTFLVKYQDSTGTERQQRIRPVDSLRAKQYRKMWTHPDMILQYAHHLRDQYAPRYDSVRVYAHVKCKLNGRDYHSFIDPQRDLARVAWTWRGGRDWILPEGPNERTNEPTEGRERSRRN